jgi:hypothetical protein
MANAAGFIQESIWRDAHWRQLSRSAQALYMQLLSQKELDCAGVLPLQPNKWAKGCSELTTEDLLQDLEELQRERFVFFDYDSDEAFIRTYVRNSNVAKIPNMRKSARRAALLIGSDRIRQILADELRATEHPDFLALADEINPSPNPSPNGSKSTVPEPLTEPTGVGVGVGTGVTSGGTSVGENRPHCSQHQDNSDGPCVACKRRREWDESHAANELDAKRTARAAAKALADNCQVCEGTHWVPNTYPVQRCDHQAVAQ